jgi:hypothetical protein
MTRHHPAARHAESRPAISEETGRGAKSRQGDTGPLASANDQRRHFPICSVPAGCTASIKKAPGEPGLPVIPHVVA